MSLFNASYVALWCAVLVSIVLNVVLFRQLGILVMGTARGVDQSGLAIGRSVPRVEMPTLEGSFWRSDRDLMRPTILFFGATYCKECRAVMPTLRKLQESDEIDVVVGLFGNRDEHRQYAQRFQLGSPVVAIEPDVAQQLDVSFTPFAYVLSAGGLVIGKGLAGSPEKLHAMLTSAGVAAPFDLDQAPKVLDETDEDEVEVRA